MKTKILNINFNVITFYDALKKLEDFLEEDKNHLLFTPNPEMVMRARKNKNFENVLNSGDLVVADGIGVVLASKLNKVKLNERVGGCDLTLALLDNLNKKGKDIYILGGKEEVCQKAVENINKKYDGINVVGHRNGYFTKDDERQIVHDIEKASPDILIIGLGMEKQESFAYKYKDKLSARLTLCVGGTVDILSGEVKRAPDIFIKFGLEWFYRLITNPSRIGRMMQLPLFVLVVIKEKIINKSR